MKQRPNIRLDSGKLVQHRMNSNGSQTAFIEGAVMTEADWQEYCAKLIQSRSDSASDQTTNPSNSPSFRSGMIAALAFEM